MFVALGSDGEFMEAFETREAAERSWLISYGKFKDRISFTLDTVYLSSCASRMVVGYVKEVHIHKEATHL